MFDLRVSARPYWLYLEASANATLEDLDQLLRTTWVECCGHLSAFEIAGTRYQADTDGIDGMWVGILRDEPDRGMEVVLGEVLDPGLRFTYEYDFGSTTRLEGTVLSLHEAPSRKGMVQILARNDPPEVVCADCPRSSGALAKVVCSECGELYCKACARNHECDEDMCLPLVNSPRAGVCGYTGSDEDA